MSCYRSVNRLAACLAVSASAAGALAAPAVALPAPPDGSGNYTFHTLNDNRDTTFNQLLGINDNGKVAGYFGSGEKGHPNKGYELLPNYRQGNYINENFPGSAQTQVTGLNNHGVTVGFWVNGKGANFGFYAVHQRHYRKVSFPTADNAKPSVDQLLGSTTAVSRSGSTPTPRAPITGSHTTSPATASVRSPWRGTRT